MSLSDTDIKRLLSTKGTNAPFKALEGVYLKDELNNLTPKNGKLYVINLASSTDKLNKDGSIGTHWVLVCNLLKATIIYFDPFGLEPPAEVLSFMKRSHNPVTNRRKKMIYNTSQVQNVSSEDCGLFCVYVAKMLLQRHKFIDIIMNFDQFNTWRNDNLVRSILDNELIGELF